MLCKCRDILFKDETLLQEFRIYLQCLEDEQMSLPPKENNHEQILNEQPEIKSQEFLIKNKNNNNNNNNKTNKTKTKDEVSITTKEKLLIIQILDLINEGTTV